LQDIDTLFSYLDEEFIFQAYHTLLGRKPDQQGAEYYLQRLRNGEYPKWRIIALLADSEEFRKHVPDPPPAVRKYLFRHKLMGFFGIRHLLRIMQLWRLPRRLDALTAEVERLQLENHRLHIWSPDAQTPDLNVFLHQIPALAQLRKRLSGSHTAPEWQKYLSALEANQEGLLHALAIHRLNLGHMKTGIMRQVNRRDRQEQSLKQRSDTLYAALTERIWQPEAFQKKRQACFETHMEQIQALAKDLGRDRLRIADIGCGRGEWLSVCAEKNHDVIGIDLNPAMIKQLQEQGLTGIHGDGIHWLTESPIAGGLDIITGLYFVEHLSFEQMAAFLDGAWHALADHGCLILETPNPEHPAVSTCLFYQDPARTAPIPPVTLKHLLQEQGFASIRITRFSPDGQVDSTGTDYAVYACKSSERHQDADSC
jgi:2-polyprenyl-3-methyl-5-hydroxy-6-metoxy-1,4-benzoquinol methylase